jgi:hypothetical protein
MARDARVSAVRSALIAAALVFLVRLCAISQVSARRPLWRVSPASDIGVDEPLDAPSKHREGRAAHRASSVPHLENLLELARGATSIQQRKEVLQSWRGQHLAALKKGKKESDRPHRIADPDLVEKWFDELAEQLFFAKPKHARGLVIPLYPSPQNLALADADGKPLAEKSYIVHLIAHTHDDVGWLKTPDQYYFGSYNSLENAGVQYILDTLITALNENPDRKFIYVEQAFFQMWWAEQTDAKKEQVKQLLQNGQLSFVNGGWCMHDEAAAHYIDMIDQTTYGHNFIAEEFGISPLSRSGWQIDPFGHSATQAALLTYEVGFDSIFFQRIDLQDHVIRAMHQELEMMWQASPLSYGETNSVFTSAFWDSYCAPLGLDYEPTSFNQPVMETPGLESNIEMVRFAFYFNMALAGSMTIGPDVAFKMGCDFHFENSEGHFKNIDKLINLINAGTTKRSKRGHHVGASNTVQTMYSTPDMYTAAKLAYTNVTWPVKTDDFFPYSDDWDGYWTGYFTSRPSLKKNVRSSSGYLQASKQLEALFGATVGLAGCTDALARSQAIAQHHDAVAGTAKQHVAYDYAARLGRGVNAAVNCTNEALASALPKLGSGASAPQLFQCGLQYMNESRCVSPVPLPAGLPNDPAGQLSFAVLLYNPLGWNLVGEVISIAVNASNPAGIRVTDAEGTEIQSTVVATAQTRATTDDELEFQLFFKANISAMGYNTYFVTTSSNSDDVGGTEAEVLKERVISSGDDDVVLSNEMVSLVFSSETGLLSSWTFHGMSGEGENITVAISQDFFFYESYVDPVGISQNSGAYVFKPANDTATRVASGSVGLTVLQSSGGLVSEVRQQFSEWLVQTVRLKSGAMDAEFEWTVGPIPIDDGKGKEVIARWTSDISSASTWYTDSNGREMQKRVRDFRPTWKWLNTQAVSGNYYPVNTHAFINGSTASSPSAPNVALTVFVDRSQGASSLSDGALEFMVHRRLLFDDSKGVGEPLNETEAILPYPLFTRLGDGLIVKGNHAVVVTKSEDAAGFYREKQAELYGPPVAFFAPVGSAGSAGWARDFYAAQSFLSAPLPPGVELITFQPWSNNSAWLLRVGNMIAGGDLLPNGQQPGSITFNLQDHFSAAIEVTEISLAGSIPLEEIRERRSKKNARKRGEHAPKEPKSRFASSLPGYNCTLSPSQIRTFKIQTWT